MTFDQLYAQYGQDWQDATAGAIPFEEWLSMNDIPVRSISTPVTTPAPVAAAPVLGGAPVAGPVAGPATQPQAVPAIGGVPGSAAGPAPGPATPPPVIPPIATAPPVSGGVVRTNRDKLDPKVADAIDAYVAKDPTQREKLDGLNGGDYLKYAEWFEGWWNDNIEGYDPAAYPDDMKILDAMELEVEGGDTDPEVDQIVDEWFGNEVINKFVVPELGKDYKGEAEGIYNQFKGGIEASAKLANDVTLQDQFSPQNYLAANPSLVAYYNANKAADGTLPGWDGVKNINDFATLHWNAHGKRLGWNMGDGITKALASEYGANDEWTQAQLDALGNRAAGMEANVLKTEGALHNNLVQAKGGYTDNLAEQMKALQAAREKNHAYRLGNIANLTPELQANLAAETAKREGNLNDALVTLGNNIDTQVEAHRQALATRMASQRSGLQAQLEGLKANLGTEMAARATALQDQLNALYSGLNEMTETQRAALGAQIQSNFDALEAEVGTKKQALETELASLGDSLDTYTAARKQALATEIEKLTAAQAPVSAARAAGAEALGTAVNLSVQGERDRIIAEMAQQGYLGGSTGTDQALLRASLAGRQDAARAKADADLANAQDDQDLARYAAGSERGLSDEAARGQMGLGQYGAGQRRGLSDYESGNRRSIQDRAAEDERNLDWAAAENLYGLKQMDAAERRGLADMGAERTRILDDFGVNETRRLGDEESEGIESIDRFKADQVRGKDDWGAGQLRGIRDDDAAGVRKIKDGEDLAIFGVKEDDAAAQLGLDKYLADSTKGIADDFTLGQKNIFDGSAAKREANQDFVLETTHKVGSTSADNRLEFFNNDLQRRLQAISLPGQMFNATLGTRAAVNEYGNTGVNNAMRYVNFFRTNAGAPPDAVTPRFTADNSSAQLWNNIGDMFAGAGAAIGKANNWNFSRGGGNSMGPTTRQSGVDGDGYGTIPDGNPFKD